MEKILTILLLIIFFCLPYLRSYPFKNLLSFAIILFILNKAFGKNWLELAGMNLPKSHLIISCVSLILSYAIFQCIYIYQTFQIKGLYFEGFSTIDDILLTPLFQSLNEEICLRAILFNSLTNHKKKLTLLIGLLFSFLHWIFYKFNMIYPISLSYVTLTNIFLFYFVGNLFFLKFKHIGFTAGTHIGWNLAKYSGTYKINGIELFEGQTFEVFESSYPLTIVLLLLLILNSYLNQLQKTYPKIST